MPSMLPERASPFPIAIVGIGCRLPRGIRGPSAFFDALRNELDLVGNLPESRPGLTRVPGFGAVTQPGGFLDGVELFDHDFFGISRREAATMDPQQRLLLEVVWEALEDAGRPGWTSSSDDVAVFLGMHSSEYAEL